MYKVDIIIPTYNRADYLKIAIESVFNQTYKDFQLYVLDNCSTDNTAKLMESYSSSQLTYIRNKENLGFIGNLNKALQTGSSEYFQIFHDDDLLEPNFLECVVEFLDRSDDLSFVHTGASIINQNNKIIKRHIKDYAPKINGNKFFKNHLKNSTSIICPSVVFRRAKILNKIQFNHNTPFTTDVIFFIECSYYGDVGYINKPLIKYRDHVGSLTSSVYDKFELKLKDRYNHKYFLESEMKKRNIDNSNDYANRYFKGALSADIWFFKVHGNSIFKIIKILPRILKTSPSLLLFLPFWFSIVKIFIPIRFIYFYKNNLRKVS